MNVASLNSLKTNGEKLSLFVGNSTFDFYTEKKITFIPHYKQASWTLYISPIKDVIKFDRFIATRRFFFCNLRNKSISILII